MEEGKKHRKYDRQFKEEAVRLATEGGRAVTEVAHGLGIHGSVNTMKTLQAAFLEKVI